MLIPASDWRPVGHDPEVARQIEGSFITLVVERNAARCTSLVRRFIASVSESCAVEMRASCWKKAVAFFDSVNAAMETSTPALSATSTSTIVKPLLAVLVTQAFIRISDGGV